MTNSEIETLVDAFKADAVEYKGRIFVAADKVLAYLSGKEIKVIRIRIEGEDDLPFSNEPI